MRELLRKYFGYSEFRDGQEEIIQSILAAKDTLVVMPTGGGKSLCFQLPALMLQGTAIVISPLIALMKDQNDSLVKNNYPATYINSSLSFEESNERIIRAKNGEYKLIYIAPERLENPYFIKILSQIHISFLAVDEAHCISEWGHDFRPSYLNIGNVMSNISISHIVALTATATPNVQTDIINSLKMRNPNLMIKGFDRKNLNYITERTNKKLDRIVEILKDTAVGSTIIYCGSRKKTEDIYGGLRDNKFDAVCYHAGMSNAERKQNQELFINGTKKIIVATNAFGMGIDKADVRNVIHTGYTSSVESYYQEAGRAGRDGLPSNCYLLYNYGDNKLQEFFINSAYPEKDEIAEVYHYLFIHKKTQLSLTAITISNAIGMSEYKVTNILGLLERLNIISINKNRTSPKIKFCYRREDLIFFLSNMNEANRIVLDSLLRSFTDDAYSRYVEIDFDTFSEKFGIRTEKISIALRNLTKSSIIEYQEEMPANTLVLLDTEKEIDNIGLDFNKLMHLKNNASDRLDIMIQFAQTDYCKRNFILDYFNDKSYLGKCGRCSSCKKTKQKSNIEFSDNDMQKVLAATLELGEHFGRVLLSHYLAGSKKDRGNKIKEYNLDKGKHFGALKEHSNNAILDIIDSLIQKNILEKSDGTYPIISVSNMGKKLLNHKVNPLPYSRNVMPIFDASTTKEKQSKTIVKPRIIKNISKTNIINNANIINTTSNAKALSLIIDKYFQEGLKIEEIASILQITNGKIGEIIQSSIEQEIITNPNNYINKSILDRVINILWDKPGILLRDLQLQLKIPINFALLRIVAAFAKKDIENAKKFGK